MRTAARSVRRRLRIALLPVPGQAGGLAAVVAVLVAVLVSIPLMLSSAEEAAWQQVRAERSATALGTTLFSAARPGAAEGEPDATQTPGGPLGRTAEFDAAVRGAGRAAGVGEPVFVARLHDPLAVLTPAGVPPRVQLVTADGAADHVDLVAGRPADDGVLLPQRLAETLGLGPGDVLSAQSRRGGVAELPVAGVYADLVSPLPPYWEPQAALFVPRPDPDTGNPAFPPAVVLGARDLVLATADAVDQDVYLQWHLPLPRGADVGEARAWADRVDRLGHELAEPSSAVARQAAAERFPRPAPRSELADALLSVDDTVALLTPPVRAVGAGGAAAALVLVGAWAALRVRRRSDELESLAARGQSPLRGAGQAVQESLLPVLGGAGVGAVAAWLLVRAGGPAGRLPLDAWSRLALPVAVGGVAALAVVGVVTVVLVSRLGQLGPGPLGQWLGRLPWLAVTAAVTVVTAVPVLTGDAGGRSIDLLTLVLPLLVVVVVAGGLTAVLPVVGRRTGAGARRLPLLPFLVVRRVLAAPGTARLLVVTTALALGVVVYAGALADSAARTVAAKSVVATPSDVVLPLLLTTAPTRPLPPGATLVGSEQDVDLAPAGLSADVLVLDPAEVLDVVGWDASLADRPLPALLDALTGYDGARVPVVVAGPVPDETAVAPGRQLELSVGVYYSLAVEVVGRADAFPGQRSQQPVLVTTWDPVETALIRAGRDPARVLDRQVWASGEAVPALDAVAAAGYGFDPAELDTGGSFAARPEVRALSWSLGYLRAVSLAAGALGLVGLAVHAAAQQRRRTVAALLLSRMGLGRRSADTAVALETGLLAGLSLVVAVAVGLPSSALVVRLLDPVPTLPPGTLVAVPWATLGGAVGGVLLATVLGAVLVGRAARRTSGGQVMRDAD